jgi:uncharacterized membrane protein
MLRIVAGFGALLHLGFAYQETFGWGPNFVRKAAPAWMREPDAQSHVAWAQKLAFNIGVYNLVLAIGLAWTAASDASMTSSLGMFFTLWLLTAAAAAAYTGVWLAVVAQGGLGLLLGVASFWMRQP